QKVAGEERPGEQGETDGSGRQATVATMLEPGDEAEERQPEQRPEDGSGRRRDLRPAIEDPREGDAGRPEQRRQAGPRRERLEQCPELLVHPCLGLALEREAPGEEVAAVDADRSAAELPAVEGDVVLESTGPAGRVVWCRLGEVAGCRRQELLVLGEHAAE